MSDLIGYLGTLAFRHPILSLFVLLLIFMVVKGRLDYESDQYGDDSPKD